MYLAMFPRFQSGASFSKCVPVAGSILTPETRGSERQIEKVANLFKRSDLTIGLLESSMSLRPPKWESLAVLNENNLNTA